MITKETKQCLVCKINLNTKKSFQEREDWESVKYCSSKCRKMDSPRGGSKKRR